MSLFEKDFKSCPKKLAGEVKEAAGRIIGNEQLERKGKIQSAKADLKKIWNVADRVDDMQQSVAGGKDDRIDRISRNEKKKK